MTLNYKKERREKKREREIFWPKMKYKCTYKPI